MAGDNWIEVRTSKPPALESTGEADTFRIRGWQIFRPGFFVHGQQFDLNTPDDCKQIILNFHALYPQFLVPKLRIGHNKAQPILARLSKSNGVPNAGRIVDMYDSDGWVTVDIDGIPRKALLLDRDEHPFEFDVLGAFKRQNFDSGSAEFLPDAIDPRNPGKKMPGLTMEAIALLGEEHPAVAGGKPIRVHYSREYLPESARVLGATERLCYSLRGVSMANGGAKMPGEVDSIETAVEPKTVEYARKYGRFYADGMSSGMDDGQADMYAAMGCSAENKTADPKEYRKRYSAHYSKRKQFSAALKYASGYEDPDMVNIPDGTPAPIGVDGTMPPGGGSAASGMDNIPVSWPDDAKQFARTMYSRMGAVEGAVQTMTPKVEEAAKYSSRFEDAQKKGKEERVKEAVDRAIIACRLAPFDRAKFEKLGMACDEALKYGKDAPGGVAGMTEFQAFLAELEVRPKLTYSAQHVAMPNVIAPGGNATDNQRAIADRIMSGNLTGKTIIAQRQAAGAK